MKKSKRVAFTLSEVLITLGIIGVVAAITIPMLTKAYQKRVVETKLEKFYSMMNQTVRMSTIDNGDTDQWVYPPKNNTDYSVLETWFNTYIKNYIKYDKTEQTSGNSLAVYFHDGSAMTFSLKAYDIGYYIYGSCIAKGSCSGGKDGFMFRLSPKISNPNSSQLITVKPYFETYAYGWDGTYEGAKYSSSPSGYGCYQDYRAMCAKLIQLNGWKIPDDYPYFK